VIEDQMALPLATATLTTLHATINETDEGA
jgi:hypothetical protein